VGTSLLTIFIALESNQVQFHHNLTIMVRFFYLKKHIQCYSLLPFIEHSSSQVLHTALLNWLVNPFYHLLLELFHLLVVYPFGNFQFSSHSLLDLAPHYFFLITRFINTRKCLSSGQLRLLFLYLDVNIF